MGWYGFFDSRSAATATLSAMCCSLTDFSIFSSIGNLAILRRSDAFRSNNSEKSLQNKVESHNVPIEKVAELALTAIAHGRWRDKLILSRDTMGLQPEGRKAKRCHHYYYKLQRQSHSPVVSEFISSRTKHQRIRLVANWCQKCARASNCNSH